MFRTALFATLLASSAAMAGQQGCAERTRLLDRLANKYGEVPVSLGLTSTGKVIEILKSDKGTWTILMTNTRGQTCAMAVGTAWTEVPMTARQPVGTGS